MTGDKKAVVEWLFAQPEGLFDIVPHKERRSRNANAYAWALISQIADVLRANKEDIYKEMLRRYGQGDLVSVLSSINVDRLFECYTKVGTGTVGGKEFTHYRVLRGSSSYDTAEMAVLIDGIVSEAQALGIETLTPTEIARLKTNWSKKE